MLAHAARRLALARAAPRSVAAIASPTRRFATGAEPTVALIDPAAIAKNMQEESARMPLSKLREMEADLVAQVSVAATPIDWDSWKSEITFPGLVDELKAEYEKLPMPDVDAAIADAEKSVNELFKPVIASCEEIAKKSAEESAALDVQMKEASFLVDNLDTMTVNEFLERNPAFKKSVEEDIANNKWFME